MPGLYLTSGPPGADRRGPTQTLERHCHFDWYEPRSLHLDHHGIGYTTYPGYPTRVIGTDDLTCYLEGEIYAGPGSDDDLLSVAETLLDRDEATVDVGDWLTTLDGEFVLCAVDERSGTVAVLNDVFGRLPLYHASTDDGVIVGREPGFLLESVPFSFDTLGIAELLLFGYTLGDRTLWTEVKKVPPGSVVVVRDGDRTVERLHEFDFDDARHGDRTVAENAAAMAEQFTEACRVRSRDDGTNVVSLSGGHDSRAVGAAFDRADLPWTAATFVKGAGGDSRDARIARDVATELGVDWQRYELPPVRGAEMRTLLCIKSGLNHLGMAFILPFFEQLRDRHGPATTYFTGDGGDKAVPDLSPGRTFDDTAALAEYTVRKNAVFSAAEAAEIACIDEHTLRDEVRTVLDAYPEDDLQRKYVHFLVHERGFNWLFEGEDRNRYFVWSTSPFYSTDFFRYAMNVPDGQKARNELYREFLAALWPASIEFPDADFATPMASPRYRLIQYGLAALDRHPRLAALAQTLYNGEFGQSYHENCSRLFREHLARSERSEPVLDETAVAAVARRRSEYSRHQVFTLLTITAAIDHQKYETPLSEIPRDRSFETA